MLNTHTKNPSVFLHKGYSKSQEQKIRNHMKQEHEAAWLESHLLLFGELTVDEAVTIMFYSLPRLY